MGKIVMAENSEILELKKEIEKLNKELKKKETQLKKITKTMALENLKESILKSEQVKKQIQKRKDSQKWNGI